MASLVPTLIIDQMVPLTNSASEAARIQSEYITAGVVLCLIALIPAILFISFGVQEKEEKQDDFEKRPGFVESLKTTFSNKTFIKFTLGNMLIWLCFNLLLTTFPLYAVFVLGITEGSFAIGITLMLALLAAAAFIPLQMYISKKIGSSGFWN